MCQRQNSSSTTKTSQSQPKKPRTTIPPPQAARIAARFIRGESMRKIAREEQRDRETVRRVVRSEDVQRYVKLLQLQFFALADPSLDAILHQLVTGKDGDSQWKS